MLPLTCVPPLEVSGQVRKGAVQRATGQVTRGQRKPAVYFFCHPMHRTRFSSLRCLEASSVVRYRQTFDKTLQ